MDRLGHGIPFNDPGVLRNTDDLPALICAMLILPTVPPVKPTFKVWLAPLVS